MSYFIDPHNVQPNGLTLLQVNPDCAARLDCEAPDHGWLYTRGPDGQWVKMRKLFERGDRNRLGSSSSRHGRTKHNEHGAITH